MRSVAEEKNNECTHDPNLLDFIDSEYRGDEAIYLFQCNCGKKLTEYFRLVDTRISDREQTPILKTRRLNNGGVKPWTNGKP